MDAALPQTARERFEAAVMRGLLRLPARAQLRLAGGTPIVLDGQRLHHEMQLALALMEADARPAIETLDAVSARAQIARTATAAGGPTMPIGEVRELHVAGAEGPLGARLYVPAERAHDDAGPLLVYFHGGGWVVCDLETHDALCRTLAEAAGVRVLAVDYRLAPEHPYPAPVDDALAAFADITARAAELGADPSRIAVGGDSAGGHLSAIIALRAARDGSPAPAFQLLIYPATDFTHPTRSYGLFADGFFLTRAQMDWFDGHFLAPSQDRADPRLSPLREPDLSGVAPAHVITAGFDPLRDEGEAYALRLREAGVRTSLRRHSGLIHGFASFAGASGAARAAVLEAAGVLRGLL